MKREMSSEQFGLRITAIIGFVILGFISICGAFWGDAGIKNIFIGIGILAGLSIFIFILSMDGGF